jgi:hypothetical protein
MMTIKQTVDIPTDRRLRFDLPLSETISGGQVEVTLTITSTETQSEPAARENLPKRIRTTLTPLKSIEECIRDAKAKTAQRLADPANDSMLKYGGCLKDSHIFDGDSVEIQGRMRDEWPD